MSITILRGNALALPLADDSVDLVVTSPPYFGLRSYQDGGEHYSGQIGDEPTPAEFVDALIAATAEMVRVVKPSGSIWVNLGDKYAGVGGPNQSGNAVGETARKQARTQNGLYDAASRNGGGVRSKSLLGIPWRYAIRCIDDLGLILRAEVIWSKPNGLPESVTDRVRRSHEQWFHFTREPRYYSAVDEIREATNPENDAHAARYREAARTYGRAATDSHPRANGNGNGIFTPNPLGKLPGSVWTVPTEPLTVPESLGIDHFAAFPSEWPRRIIAGWSPREVCTVCGEGRRPVVARGESFLSAHPMPHPTAADGDIRKQRAKGQKHQDWKNAHPDAITGYACACPDTSAPATPGVVLDPFGGTGTTALVADVLGRDGITVDLSADYCRLAEWRTTDPKQRARAARVEAVEPVSDDQPDLFEESAS